MRYNYGRTISSIRGREARGRGWGGLGVGGVGVYSVQVLDGKYITVQDLAYTGSGNSFFQSDITFTDILMTCI